MAGRILLIGVVVFWWSGYVIPHLLSLVFPALLPPWNSTLGRLNADSEGSIANAVSAATLAAVTLLALAAALVNYRRSGGWIAVGGWVAIAATTAGLTFEELVEFKRLGPISIVGHAERLDLPWPLLVSPLVVVYVLAMSIFVQRGLGARKGRPLLILGIACWVFALVHEAMDPWVFAGRAIAIEYVLEETLEYSGTLLVGLSAVSMLQPERTPTYCVFGRRWRLVLAGSVAAVITLGGLAVLFLFRAPLVEALAPYSRAGAFDIALRQQEAVVQELRMPATPLHSLRLRLANCDLRGQAATVGVRLTPLGMSDRILSQGSVEIPVGDCPRWRDVELLPPAAAAEGETMAIHVVADVVSAAELRVGATKGYLYSDGRLWINGDLAWPDQNLEFVAYSAPELTRSKLQAIWRLATSDWRWPVLAADIVIALSLIMYIPAILVASACRWPSKRLRMLRDGG